MDKLAQLRVSPAWAAALTACLDEPPPTKGRFAWLTRLFHFTPRTRK